MLPNMHRKSLGRYVGKPYARFDLYRAAPMHRQKKRGPGRSGRTCQRLRLSNLVISATTYELPLKRPLHIKGVTPSGFAALVYFLFNSFLLDSIGYICARLRASTASNLQSIDRTSACSRSGAGSFGNMAIGPLPPAIRSSAVTALLPILAPIPAPAAPPLVATAAFSKSIFSPPVTLLATEPAPPASIVSLTACADVIVPRRAC